MENIVTIITSIWVTIILFICGVAYFLFEVKIVPIDVAWKITWSVIAIALLLVTLAILWVCAEYFKRLGSSFLYKDMKYLGYAYNPATGSLEVQHVEASGKPYNRLFAFFAYKADILSLVPRKSSAILEREHGPIIQTARYQYVNGNLRREVYESIKLEKQLVANGVISKVEGAPFPIASYVFASLKDGELKVDKSRLGFFYRNSYTPDSVYRLRDIELAELEAFDGVPSTWVCYALLGDGTN